MYHSLREDESYLGTYVISPETFEADLIYLQEHGYTSVSVAELIAYVSDPEATLPEKPVLITFATAIQQLYLCVSAAEKI
jgi:hypothetical protein